MNKMKESGIEWIGEIPREWKVLKSRYFLKEISLIGYPDEEVLSLYRDYGIVPKNSRSDNYNVTSLNTSGYKYVRPGYLVINKMKAWQGSMAISDFQGIVSPAYYTYEVDNTTFDLRFLHYALRNPAYNQEYRRISAGLRIGQWDLNKNEFKNLRYAYPIDKTVQKKIATFLDDKSVLIDEIISDTKKTIEELEAYKKSMISEVVTKGLNPNVTLKPSGVEWIENCPREWDKFTIGQLFKQVKQKNTGMIERNLLSLSYGRIKRRDINSGDGLLPESFEGYNIIEKDDIVLRMTDLQNDKTSLRQGIAEERGIITSAYITMRATQKVSPRFVYYQLFGFDVNKGYYGMGSGVRQSVNWNDIKKLSLILPEFKLQQEIAEYLDKKMEQIDALKAEKETLISEYESYKKSMIYEYVTGKKQVED